MSSLSLCKFSCVQNGMKWQKCLLIPLLWIRVLKTCSFQLDLVLWKLTESFVKIKSVQEGGQQYVIDKGF